MSIPPLPAGLTNSRPARAANAVHSAAVRILRRARMADRESGLGPERLSLLSVLVFAGPQTIGSLAEIEGVSTAAISRIVTALETAGLAEKARGESDGRVVHVSATARGRALLERGRRRRVELIAALLKDLPEKDLATLERAAELLARLEG